MIKKLALLGLFLYKSAFALFVDVEALKQKISIERPNTYARLLRALPYGYSNDYMDPITYAHYQKLLAKNGSLTIDFIFEKDIQAPRIRVTKLTDEETPLCLFSNRSIDLGQIKLETHEHTPFVKLEPDIAGWQLRINDGVRNKIFAHISTSGDLIIDSGMGLDTLEVKTSAALIFNGILTFPKIELQTNRAYNSGILEVGTLSLKQSDTSASSFTNAGDLQLTDLLIDKCTFSNENKIKSQKQFNLYIESGDFVNGKDDTNFVGIVEAEVFNLAGVMGTFFNSNRGTLKVVTLQGAIHKLINEGNIQIKSGEKCAVNLVGQTLENKKDWRATCGMDLQFRYIENSGNVAALSLILQADGTIQNHVGAMLYGAEKIILNGKGSLTNKGDIIGGQQLSLKVNSTTNEGVLLAKDLLNIDNDGNYFKNTATGSIETEGVLKVAATGCWWVNEGQVVAGEIQSQGDLTNIKSGRISSKRGTYNGRLFNDAFLAAGILNIDAPDIGGAGKLMMINGQIKIDGDHVQLGKWSCSGDCGWSASKFSIGGSVEGKTDSGQPVQLIINSEKGELWHNGDLYCASGASCATVSAGKTVNMGKTTSDGTVTQQSTGGDVRNEGPVGGNGNYIANAKNDVINRNKIDVAGNVVLKAGNDVRNEKTIQGGSVTMDADKTLENAGGAEVNSLGDTTFKGENIRQYGKVTTSGKFTGKAVETFTNLGDLTSGSATFDANTMINKGKILTKNDLEGFASKLFLNEGGTFNTGRDATIIGGTVRNVAGRILVGHLLTIHAKKLENTRAPTIMKPGEDCPQPPVGGTRTCQGDYEVETSDAALIYSRGNIVLDIGEGANIASTIYAKGNITITGSQFKNLAHNLKNYKVTKGWQHYETCKWWGLFGCDDNDEPNTTVRNELVYIGATLGADGDITINNQKVDSNPVKGFENTGSVQAGETFTLVSEEQTYKLINGLFDSHTSTAEAPASKTGEFKIYEYLDLFGNLYYFRITAADELDPKTNKKIQFIIIPGSEIDEQALNQQIGTVTRNLSECPQIAYLQKENETSPPTHTFIMHPQLSAQIVQSMLATELGTSHLSDFEGKTAMEQYEALETQGYQYAQKMIGGSTSADALPLKLEQITKAEETFIYYDLVEHEGITGYVPVLHIGLPEAKKHVPGTEGTIEASNILVETAGDVENTGTLKSTGKLKITSHLFKNRRREYKATETVKEQDDIWGNTRTRVFEVRTPEIGGDIIGVDIELTAKEDLVNEGGKIVGAQKVYLISEKGNIEHKALVGQHVVHWHQCGWDKAMGRDSAGEALDYYSAEIISGGEVKLDAKVNKVLVKASEIIGTGDVNVSGYSGVSVNGEMSKHTTANTHNIMGNGNYEEIVVSQRSTISSLAGNVTFKAPEGTLNMSATTVTAPQGAVILDAKNVNLGVQSLQYTKSKSEAAGGFSIGSTKTEVVQTAVEPMVITALKGITMKAVEDNVLEAVFAHSGGFIHIVAGRDNRFKGFEKKTNITTEGWNVGISFPGSDAVEKMMDGKKGDAIKSLRDGDPLLSAMNRLRQAQDAASKVAEGTYVAVEALRALDQYLKMSEQPGATASDMLGQRMGLTDANGNFAPQITLHVGQFKSETHMTDVIRTSLDAKSDVEITSVQNTHLLDGTIIKSNDRILIVAQDVTTSPAQDTIHSESQGGSFSVGYGAAGWSASASVSESHSNTLTNHNVQLNADKIDVRATNLDGKAVNMEGKEITLDVKNNLTLESVQDTASGSSTSIGGGTSFTGGSTSGSASFANDSVDKARVNTPAGIHATESLKIKVGGTLYLIGGVINGPKDHTDITSREVKVEHIPDHDDKSSYGFSAQFPIGADSATNPVSATVDADFKQETYTGATQATISEGARLEVQRITDDLKKINRDLDKIQVGSSDETHFRAVIPTLNLEQIQDDMHRLKELLGGETKPKSYESEDSEYEMILEFMDSQDDEFQESTESAEDKQSSADGEKEASVKKLGVVSTESVTGDGYEGRVTTLDVINVDGQSLGEVRIGDFKESSEKHQSQDAYTSKDEDGQPFLVPPYNPLLSENYSTASFTDANGMSTLIKSYNGRRLVLQGEASTIKKIGARLGGVLKMAGGAGEAISGVGIAFGGSGTGILIGVGAIMIVHGTDTFTTGAKQAFTATPQSTAVEQMLESFGFSHSQALIGDASIGVLFSGSAIAIESKFLLESIPHAADLVKEIVSHNLNHERNKQEEKWHEKSNVAVFPQ